jgi:hypothetical protein
VVNFSDRSIGGVLGLAQWMGESCVMGWTVGATATQDCGPLGDIMRQQCRLESGHPQYAHQHGGGCPYQRTDEAAGVRGGIEEACGRGGVTRG